MKKTFTAVLILALIICTIGCGFKKPIKINLAQRYQNINGFKSDISVTTNGNELFAFNFETTKDSYFATIISPEFLKNVAIGEKNGTQSISYNNLKFDVNLLSDNQKSALNLFCIKTGFIYELALNSKAKNENGIISLEHKGTVISFDNEYKITMISNNEYVAKFTNFEFLE